MDSGVDYTHAEFAGAMWTDRKGKFGYDFVDNDADPMDVGGHGTHVASIVAARSGDGIGMAGIANAKIMAVRVIGPDGTGTDEALASGIDYCRTNGAHIISLSLSLDARNKVVERALGNAAKANMVIVASASNDPCDWCITPLDRVASALTVTSVGPTGERSSFAPWTNKTNLAAPGEDIVGAIPGGYALASGSSQAVPHVSGAAVLVWTANASLPAKDVAKFIEKSATQKLDAATGRMMRVLDVEAAVQMARYPPVSSD